MHVLLLPCYYQNNVEACFPMHLVFMLLIITWYKEKYQSENQQEMFTAAIHEHTNSSKYHSFEQAVPIATTFMNLMNH